jgi:hypothetical protein
VVFVVDKETIDRKYNRVLRLLLQVKYARHVLEKRDYHVREPNLLRRSTCYSQNKGERWRQQKDEMGVRETILLENQLLLGNLLHKVEILQAELLHFARTMDDYFSSHATFAESSQLLRKLAAIANAEDDDVKDLDDVISLHDAMLNRVLQLCLLDNKSADYLRFITDMVDVCIEFRRLVKEYLHGDSDLDEEELGGIRDGEGSRQRRAEAAFNGVGRLRFDSPDFLRDSETCLDSLHELRKKFRKLILVFTSKLDKLTKKPSGKIILSHLLTILERLDYNRHYMGQID